MLTPMFSGVTAVAGIAVYGGYVAKQKYFDTPPDGLSDDGFDDEQNLVRMHRIWYELWKHCGGKWPESSVFRVEESAERSSELLKSFANVEDVHEEWMEKALRFEETKQVNNASSEFTTNDYSTAFKRCLGRNPALLNAEIMLRNDLSIEAVISNMGFDLNPTERQIFRFVLKVCVLILKKENPDLEHQLKLNGKELSGVELSDEEVRTAHRLSATMQSISMCISPRLFRD
eukprot:430151_1